MLILAFAMALIARADGQDHRPVFVDSGVFRADQAQFSADGRYMVYRAGAQLTVWDTKNQSTVLAFATSPGWLVAMSNDAKYAAMRSYEGEQWRITIWNLRLGRPIHSLDQGSVVAFSPDGDRLAVAHEHKIRIVDVRSGKVLRQLGSTCHAEGVQERLRALSYHPGPQDGTLGSLTAAAIEAFQADRRLRRDGKLTDAVCRELGLSVTAHGNGISAIAFTPDGGSVVTTAWADDSDYAYGASVVVWRWLDGTIAARYGTLTETVSEISFSPDGCVLFLSGSNVRAFAFDTGQELARRHTEEESLHPLASVASVSADGRRLLLLDKRRSAFVLWEWESNSELRAIASAGDPLGAAFGADQDRVLVCSASSGVLEYDVVEGKVTRSPPGVLRILKDIAFSPDGRYLAVTTWGGAYIWDLAAGAIRPVDDVVGLGTLWHVMWGSSFWRFDSPRITDEGKLLAINVKGAVARWAVETGNLEDTFVVPVMDDLQPVIDVTSTDVVVATGKQEVAVHNLLTGAVSVKFSAGEPVYAAAATKAGDLLAIAGKSGVIRVLDRRTGEEIASLVAGCYQMRCTGSEQRGPVNGLRFSRNGNVLISFHADRSPQIWSVPGRRRVRSLGYKSSKAADPDIVDYSELTTSAYTASISPDETRVATGYTNGTLIVTDLESGREEYRTTIGDSYLLDVVWSPDGRYIAATSGDYVLRVWDAATGRDIAALRVMAEDDWLLVSSDGRYNGSRRALRTLRVVADGIYRRLADADYRPTPEPFRLAPTTSEKGPVAISNVTSPRPSHLGSYRRKYAVIIGVARHANLKDRPRRGELPNLRFADRDGREFEAFLRDARISGGGWEITTLLNEQATAKAVDDALTTVLTKAQEEDFVIIFFSGHGRAHPIRQQDVYLLTHDFDPQDARSGYSYTVLQQMISDTKAHHVLAFIDACRSGEIGFGDKAGAAAGQFSQEVFERLQAQSPPNRLIFSSGRDTQGSNEDPDARLGLFTKHLLRGLKGEAPDRKNPHYVDLGELRDYVRDAVVDGCRKNNRPMQVPELWEKFGTTYEDFPLAIRR